MSVFTISVAFLLFRTRTGNVVQIGAFFFVFSSKIHDFLI